MTEQYGPVFSLRQGPCVFVIIGRHRAAMDIMEKTGCLRCRQAPLNRSWGDTFWRNETSL